MLLGGDGAAFTGNDFVRAVTARVGALRAAGLARQDICLVGSRRGCAFWTDLVAVWAMGAIAAPVDGQIGESSFQAILQLVQPRAAIGLGGDVAIIDERASVGATSPPRENADDVAALLFTSGSTGGPKAVEVTDLALMGNANATCEVLPVDSSTRLAIAIPFHFTSAICHFLAAMSRGAVLLGTERPLLAADLAEYVLSSRANAFGGAPLQIRWLGQCADRIRGRLRWVMSSGDHLPETVIRDVRGGLPGTAIYTVYGLTEVCGRLCILAPDLIDDHIGSVGFPIPGMSISVRDDDGREVAPGTVGEVYAAGLYLGRRYYGDPVASAHAFTVHGFRSGDLGSVAADGTLWLRGRADDVFKVAGQKVSGPLIAAGLCSIGFLDATVLPVDDPIIGTVAHACVTLAPNSHLDVGATLAALRQIVPPNHVPRRLIAVPAIPRTGSGKVDRVALRQLLYGPQ